MQELVKSIPEPTLRRLPLHYRLLKQLREGRRAGVLCTMIGAELKLEPTQVCKDIEMTGTVSRPKVGYDISELLCAIERFLGRDNTIEAFLVGVGSLKP